MDNSSLSLAGLACHLVSPNRADQLVILCHGYGAPGPDLVPLAGELDRHTASARIAYLFPEAPLTLDVGGRAWWHLDIAAIQAAVAGGDLDKLAHQEPPGLQRVAGVVGRLVGEACRHLDISLQAVTLGGFSQGAMVATEVALTIPGGPRALCILSGQVLAESRWRDAAAVRGPLRVFQSHGRQDPVLPIVGARRLAGLLRDSGLQVESLEFDGGHDLPAQVLEQLGRFLAAPR